MSRSKHVSQTSEISLKGKRVLLLGGDPRPYQKDKIEHELGLSYLWWIETRANTSVERLERVIAGDDFDLVVIALRWARYRFSGLVNTCSNRGIPFLRMPGGISPAQILHQASLQVSQRLSHS